MLRKCIQGFRYAFTGLTLAWKGELNFRIEIALAVLATVLAVRLHLSLLEGALVALVISLVLVAEVFNTALEELCDTFQTTHHPRIAKVKDLAAAAVLLASAGALVVGALVFLPHLV
ncbi:MAG: diacylglycerol kinase [Minisyncoccota bacterium]